MLVTGIPKEEASGPPFSHPLDEATPFASRETGIHRNVPHPHRSCLYGLVGEVACAGGEGTETNPYAIAANFIANLLNRHRWIAYVGLAIILYVALDMIYRGALEVMPYLSAG